MDENQVPLSDITIIVNQPGRPMRYLVVAESVRDLRVEVDTLTRQRSWDVDDPEFVIERLKPTGEYRVTFVAAADESSAAVTLYEIPRGGEPPTQLQGALWRDERDHSEAPSDPSSTNRNGTPLSTTPDIGSTADNSTPSRSTD